MTSVGVRAAIIASMSSCVIAGPLRAQTTTLAITSGSASTFAQPTLADYVTGYVDGPTITFTVSLVGGAAGATHTTTVEVCATSGNLGSGKSLSKLLWQPSDGSKPWQSITNGCNGPVKASRTVGAQSLANGGSWSGGVRLRMVLDWTDTAPAYGTTMGMTVAVSTP
ncbi:MAG TPA: hypothetical protein VLN49_20250 [Gemmatimonadaceae bacterium]|nr:hypothetical protein [Gemmatimonadaceae bacterium]